MRLFFARYLLLFLMICCACEGYAQVRVRRIPLSFRLQNNKKQKIKTNKLRKETPKSVTTVIKPATIGGTRGNMDELFYVRWSAKKGLNYRDFRYNKNLYNKFLPARDTDLTNTIYPDYREFYKKLNERVSENQQVDDSLWHAKIEVLINEYRNGSSNGFMTEVLADSGQMLTISIDSPAASVISIQPTIFAIDNNTFYYNITALFSKQESWMMVKSEDILVHEQIHFDIFELYARKMRKYLVALLKENNSYSSESDLTNALAPVFERLNDRLNDMQLEFDRQTAVLTASNSSLIRINAAWKSSLAKQINELSEYAAPEGTITLN